MRGSHSDCQSAVGQAEEEADELEEVAVGFAEVVAVPSVCWSAVGEEVDRHLRDLCLRRRNHLWR